MKSIKDIIYSRVSLVEMLGIVISMYRGMFGDYWVVVDEEELVRHVRRLLTALPTESPVR